MKTKNWILATLAFATTALVSPLAANADVVDNWCTTYVTQEKGGVHRITIRKDAGKVKIHAIGSGSPNDIDWGESTADVYWDEGGNLPRFVSHHSVGNAKSMVVVEPNSGGSVPHQGGVIVCDVYMQPSDGKPQSYVRQSLNTEKEPTTK